MYISVVVIFFSVILNRYFCAENLRRPQNRTVGVRLVIWLLRAGTKHPGHGGQNSTNPSAPEKTLGLH